ncbi:MAG TPA: hypothetical protein PLR41_13780 [Alphaproteobacteria bacterium]|nr:hypothetical protein [Alphaproteobacteria bacterium]
MGHYIRILSPSEMRVPLTRLMDALEDLGAPVAISGDSAETTWRQIVLAHPEGRDIATVECDLVEPGSLAEEEIGELLEGIAKARPASAAAWLKAYLPKVKAIYAIQVVAGAEEGEGWDVIDTIRQTLMEQAGGIIQADNEGYSNEEGYHILWQFADDVEGTWWMAVLKNGRWVKFEMDLGDPDHRAAFLAGEVPDGAHLAD